VIYRKDQDPRNADGKMHMCAPDCVQGPDGRYYLYYQLHVLTCTCVAVADSPVGPFAYYGCMHHPAGTPWGEKKGDSFAFDPGVLVDDDGKVYLYVGHSPAPGFYKTILMLRGNRLEEAVCLELEPDMLTVRGGDLVKIGLRSPASWRFLPEKRPCTLSMKAAGVWTLRPLKSGHEKSL